jgi:hypothetical protein
LRGGGGKSARTIGDVPSIQTSEKLAEKKASAEALA